ncbi:MAG: hypothetical protein KGN79_05430, partial [Acidobacteriota bacterium]|nr:hypothetical protein [Acidobacteriota bacterium]
APLTDWSESFAEQWRRNVLEGPPRIPWLHMTDIRSRKWREKHGITRAQGERRVKAAFELISETPSLTPIGTDLNAGHLIDRFDKKMRFRCGARRGFKPDYLAFIAYAYSVLIFCDRVRPEAEKVNFLVERNNDITNHIQEFYEDLPKALAGVGLARLVPLMGELLPDDKNCVALQAADVLCWYSQRFREGNLNDKNIRRYAVIALRKGIRLDLTNKDLDKLWKAITDDGGSEEFSEQQRFEAHHGRNFDLPDES